MYKKGNNHFRNSKIIIFLLKNFISNIDIVQQIIFLLIVFFLEKCYKKLRYRSKKKKEPPTTTFQQHQRLVKQTNLNHQHALHFKKIPTHSKKHLIPVVRHAPLSESQYEPTSNIYPSFQQEFNRTPSQNQKQSSTIERQTKHPRRKRNFATPRVNFNIPASPSQSLLVLYSNTNQSTTHHYKQFHNKILQISHRII